LIIRTEYVWLHVEVGVRVGSNVNCCTGKCPGSRSSCEPELVGDVLGHIAVVVDVIS